MILAYIISWTHLYVMHFGAWMTLLAGGTVYKDGLPKKSEIWPMLQSALILSLILSLFSSHSHAHYLSMLTSK